eukprot:89298_1
MSRYKSHSAVKTESLGESGDFSESDLEDTSLVAGEVDLYESSGLGLRSKEGNLWKKSKVVKRWERLLFILKDSTLSYYKSSKHSSDRRVTRINLQSANISLAPEDKYNRKFSFEIGSPENQRLYVLAAENAKDLNSWISLLQDASISSVVPKDSLS